MNSPEPIETILESSDLLPTTPSTHMGRRTVVRGASWAVPLVAVASAVAPAFAASDFSPPSFGELTACKLPGSVRNFSYRFSVPYNGTLDQVLIVSLTLNGSEYTPTNLVADGTNLTFTVSTTNSADASGSGVVVVTFNGQTLPPEPFSYDGTKPCKP